MPIDAPPDPSTVPPPPPPAPPPVASGPQRNVVMLVLSYLGVLALIPFLTEKNDPEVKWHSRHGLVLFGAEIIVWMGLMFMSFIVHFLFFLFPLFSLAVLILHVLMIVKAINGERLLIPGISQYADKL
jgi:uncharacterized membrane protein